MCSRASGQRARARAGLRGDTLWPVRLGFNRLLGFQQEAAKRLIEARVARPFDSVEDLARRAALDDHMMQLLSQGDALAPLTGHRHQAAWATAGVDTRASAMLARTRTHEVQAELQAPSAGEDLLADYRSTGLSLKNHPLKLLRGQLAAFRVQPACVLNGYRPGQLARASGLVTHRQRPETAKGVIFVTLEDETGAVNVIVWPQVAQAQRKPLLASTLLTVYGVWQCEGEVRHLIARKLVDHSHLLRGWWPGAATSTEPACHRALRQPAPACQNARLWPHKQSPRSCASGSSRRRARAAAPKTCCSPCAAADGTKPPRSMRWRPRWSNTSRRTPRKRCCRRRCRCPAPTSAATRAWCRCPIARSRS